MLSVEFRSKRRWQDALDDRWIRSKVDQQPSLDRAFDDWNAHRRGSTLQICDLAPLTSGMQLKRHRWVRCIWFVGPAHHMRCGLTSLPEESSSRSSTYPA